MYKFFLAICSLLFIKQTYSQTVQLDSVFGNAGQVYLEGFFARGLLYNSDSSLLITFSDGFQIRKLNEDGTVDSTFGINGTSAELQGVSYDAILQNNGNIVQVGNDGSFGCVFTCHLPNGALDSSFGDNGKLFLANVGIGVESAGGLATQNDGKILFSGTDGYLMIIVRLNSNGTLDSTFNNSGIKSINLPYAIDLGAGIAELSNGSIIVTGYSFDFFEPDEVQAIRLFSNGTIDSTFGTNGIFSIDTGPFDYSTDMDIQSDGKIVIGGYAKKEVYPFDYECTAVRCDMNGKVDSSFGNDGLVIISGNPGTSTYDYFRALVLQPDGKIILAGSSSIYGMLVRLLPNGYPDPTFFGDGIVKSDSCKSFHRVLIQPDGKIVAAGSYVVRYLNNFMTGPCTSDFLLYPDTFELHKYWAINLATGIPPINYIWSWGDGTYDTIPYPSHTYDTAGFYTICLSIYDSSGCGNTFCNSFDLLKQSYLNKENGMIQVNVVSDIPVNIPPENNHLNQLSIYPNPASKNIHLQFSKSLEDPHLTVSVSNYFGKVIYAEASEISQANKSLFVSLSPDFSPGYYIVTVEADKQTLIAPLIILR